VSSKEVQLILKEIGMEAEEGAGGVPFGLSSSKAWEAQKKLIGYLEGGVG
jgi:hypothetical protein